MKISRIRIVGNLIGLAPGIYLIYQLVAGTLSANPVQTATVITGRSAVYALLISLYCSPLAYALKFSVFHRVRKISGLFAFYYALAHFLIFSAWDYQANLSWIVPEIKQKFFLQIGLLALLLLIPLAVTSIKQLKQKMKKNWKKLHNLVYGIAVLILVHITLASKGDIIDPAILIFLFLFAMILRLPFIKSFQVDSPPAWMQKLNTFLIK